MNLELQNKCLLSKWLFSLINEDGVWQQLLCNKYLRNKSIAQVKYKPGDSQFWAGLMKVKTEFLRLGSFTLHNGSQIRFWEDVWLGQTKFSQLYSSLYNIVYRKHPTVAEVLGSVPLHISFRRALVGAKLVAWNELVLRLASIQLIDGRDTFR